MEHIHCVVYIRSWLNSEYEYYYFISAIVGYIGTATEHIPLYYSMFVFQSIHPIQCQTCPVSPKINKKSEDELQSNPLNTKNLKEMQRFSKSDAAKKRKKYRDSRWTS